MAKIKSNAHLYVSLVGAPDPVATTITSVTKANPAVVTPTTMPVGQLAGDFALFTGTGEPMLDGHAFRTANKTATSFELEDVDGSKFAAAITKGSYQLFDVSASTTMLSACMAQVTVTGTAADTINLDDMCGTQTLYGDAKPPTFSFSGFIDQDSEGFSNLVRASVTAPKPTVWVLVDYTDQGGFIFGQAQIGEITVTAGTNQGLQFSGTGTFSEVPTYSWAL